uniref:Angiotensin-converting enzyme n=1 Tax=Graphocephala atropunctata TaxID=36148 RepID=A0A1B6KA09_9HEMI
MACVSRPKPPAFWGQTTVLVVILVLVQVTQTGSEAQVDVPPDSLYFDPRYQFNPSPPPFRGRPQAKADQRSLNPLYQEFNPYSQIPQRGFPPTPDSKPVKEVTLDDALNAFLKTQDPKYYQYYQGGDPRVGTPDVTPGPPGTPYTADPQVAALLKQIDSVGSQQCASNVLAQWNFETNVNEVTQLEALRAQLAYSEFQARVRTLASKIERGTVGDPQLWRQLRHLAVIGPAALPPDQLDRYNRVINDMLEIFNSATICAYNEPLRCGLRLEPDIQNIMAHSHDWDELQHTWVEWNRRSGMKVRDLYEQLVDLSNYAARLNNFTDYAEYWMFPYEAASLRFDLEDVWEEIRPLYEQLHAYIRRKLRDLYGPEKISRQAPLPAHILGNMWAQSWSNILDVTIPYPGKNFLDVTTEMNKQGYTPGTMFRLAEEFYVSMNFSGLPPDFWTHSILEDLPGRQIICQPSAWDFCNGRDYRIKMCTQVTMQDLITAHHEMAHIHYFMTYKNQPKVFRDGANPGFHEAISEAVSLSVTTPHHLQTLGLVLRSVDDIPHNINFLFSMALDKVAFLPFALALDFWRWDIFQGSTPRDRYNCHWWDLRERLSGIKPPVLRSETDFDPGSKYHVPANIPYIRYFVGTVLQFQIHRALCKAAQQSEHNNAYGQPLHKCDIYRSKEAGHVLQKLMEKGSSEAWSEVLYAATGETRLDGTAIREYFRPLEEWLRNENLRTQEFVGWNYDGDYCKYSIETANLQVYGGFYNKANSRTNTLTLLALPVFVLLLSTYFAF